MFKIGEFSKITQISVRMLRYYDEQKLLEPCLIDDSNGYRYYFAKQIDQLNRIILLRNMGFGVKEIKAMLETWNSENIKNNLLEQMKKTKENIQSEKIKLQQMQGWLYDLNNQGKKLNIEIIMKSLPMQHVMSIRRIVPDYYYESMLWQEFGEVFNNVRNVDKLQSFSIYHDLDYREKDVDIEICVVVDQFDLFTENKDIIYRQIEKVDMAACFMIYGPYENISLAYKEFACWLERHNEYQMQGENRQVCHVSMCHTNNPEEYITELQIPLLYTSK
ncbi:DNA-binding transcriptional MerR regulator [Lachnotalea glycerini]|uniref:DNA-binding transcriptional MerR regulator n=1 Tax=Lachnotalea glycerini TaxID=1763509 RepID=A0A255IPJ1_9FIRM|nr:MerR family transcriptional regulator [Lachnotalea glycerini]PXV87809.1 DNA-binding transcriptional MerR regulator [Lachnotalea glycerini]RDY30093.1 MerR family transcriptional regulator [Lachnotalea glycerini]